MGIEEERRRLVECREAFKRDALRAWEGYQATGLHAPGDEVEKWLASWGTDQERPSPVCHQ